MEFLTAAWAFLDGHKTKAGAFLVFVGKALSANGQAELGGPLEQIGLYLAGLGLAHAAVKAVQG